MIASIPPLIIAKRPMVKGEVNSFNAKS
jgi:hypothetical protein